MMKFEIDYCSPFHINNTASFRWPFTLVSNTLLLHVEILISGLVPEESYTYQTADSPPLVNKLLLLMSDHLNSAKPENILQHHNRLSWQKVCMSDAKHSSH